MTQKILSITCLCFLLCSLAFAQRRGPSQGGVTNSGLTLTPTVSDSIVGFQLDSLSRTHAYLSWGITKRVMEYKVTYQADSVIQTQKITGTAVTSVLTQGLSLTRTRNANLEIWKITATYTDGTVSPAAIATDGGIVISIDEIYATVNDHCTHGSSHDPEMEVVFYDLCVAADMDLLCEKSHQYLMQHQVEMPVEDWVNMLNQLAEIENSGVEHVLDCEDGALRRGSEAIAALSVKAYPNPVNDMLRVELHAHQVIDAEILLKDYTGRVVYKTLISSTHSDAHSIIHTSRLSPGLYTLQVRQDGTVQTHKIIKR